jgi:hypothetical protein
MWIPTFLAHGALGIWDEIIFLGIAVVFIVMMGISWFRSRVADPEFDDDMLEATNGAASGRAANPQEDDERSGDRFKLD